MIKTAEQKVLKFIDENHLINKGDKVLVALSGGADSVFLLNFLVKYKKRLNIKIGALHVNHLLRGKEAVQDAAFCRKLCRQNRVKYFEVNKRVKQFAQKNKISVEEAGRIIRYTELINTAAENNFNKIATAHNSTDNAETMLLNLIKGTGIKGIAGIPVNRENIVRPVLCLSASEIRNYLKKKGIDYRIDISNLSSDFERNFLRNEIIPQLRKRLNPKLENTLLKSSSNFKNISSFIDEVISKSIKRAAAFKNSELVIYLDELKKLNAALQGEFIKTTIQKYFPVGLSNENIIAVLSLIKKQKGRSAAIGGNLQVVKEEETLIVKTTERKKKTNSVKIKIGETKKLNDTAIKISTLKKSDVKKTKNGKLEFVSGDKLSNIFMLRIWKNGDRFYPLGMKGSKKISDFLNGQKVPFHIKKEQMVLTNSGRIVWVVGYRIDDRFKITTKTKKVIKLCRV